MRSVYARLLSLVDGKRILDCGCGFGQFARTAIDAGYDVTPIDIDEDSLAIARDVYNVPCLRVSAYETSLQDGSCDTAVCNDSISIWIFSGLRRSSPASACVVS
ncbi:class I SAM-dependent methyltransferase [Bradyrhizobium sp. sBnM-33]